jgi:hypothetical protein
MFLIFNELMNVFFTREKIDSDVPMSKTDIYET